jgi:hypothetical protein
MTDIYVLGEGALGKFTGGASIKKFVALINITTANATGDIIRFCSGLTSDAVVTSIKASNTAITALSDVDLGVYAAEHGEEYKKDLLADGISVVAAKARSAAAETYSPAIANSQLSIRQLENKINGANAKIKDGMPVDLALTLNATPTAAGTICLDVEYV